MTATFTHNFEKVKQRDPLTSRQANAYWVAPRPYQPNCLLPVNHN
jgi:hypothetical protein